MDTYISSLAIWVVDAERVELWTRGCSCRAVEDDVAVGLEHPHEEHQDEQGAREHLASLQD